MSVISPTPSSPPLLIRRWALNLWNQPLRRSLRFQFTLSMLMLLIPSFALSYLAVSQLAINSMSQLVRGRLNDEASLLAYGLREWERSKRQTMASLALVPALRSRDQAGIRSVLNGLATIYPDRIWAYFAVDEKPRLLVYSGAAIPSQRQLAIENLIQSKPAYQQALRGWPGYGIERSLITGNVCLMRYQPVYRSGLVPLDEIDLLLPMQAKADSALRAGIHPLQRKYREQPTAVLKSCIPIDDLGHDTGLAKALANSRLANIQGIKGDFSSNKPLKRAFVLLSRNGHILYPTKQATEAVVTTVAEYEKGYWGPLFRMIDATIRTGERETFRELTIGAETYVVLINQVSQSWHVMMMLNKKYAFAFVTEALQRLVFCGILCLILASLAAAWFIGRILTPIREVSGTLRRISQGDFEARIRHQRKDEIGQLLDDVNRTSERLKEFLISETAHAVTRKQLETARVIQKDFLVETMPETVGLELEPLAIPAYEVGADWYDALAVGGLVYFVVADVCDKGIPSALYMSVFRSLLRYGLLSWGNETDSPDLRLCHAMTSVNDYMAANHGGSMMFATVFIAALDPESGKFSYISAGHEMPMISAAAGLRSLEPTGPAIGLFAGCHYAIGSDQLAPGDYLVAYTDGLTDARSPAGAAWGHEALGDVLQLRRGSQPSAATLRADLLSAVQAHMAGAAYFDDLTLMVVHRKA